MPDPTLAQAAREAYASAPANTVILHTLELRHAAFSVPIRVVRDHVDWNLTLEASAPANPSTEVLFTAFAFDAKPPSINAQGNPEITITIDNVTRELEDQIQAAIATRTKIEATWRIYLNADTTGPQNDPPAHLTITNVRANNSRVTARASYGDFVNRRFPNEDYTARRFPGLVR